MVQRSVALCEGVYVGIETIYTVVNGKQINIEDKLQLLRKKSNDSLLFCPCGCGKNLILVAGDQMIKAQHFRIKNEEDGKECNYQGEGKTSAESKIVLNCWLNNKLKIDDLTSRVAINAISDSDRRYEYSFLSKKKKIAIEYFYDKNNITDDKLEILKKYSGDIHIVYITDEKNADNLGQYPEHMMKIQAIQGYCLFLKIDGQDYAKASLIGIKYIKRKSGEWFPFTISIGSIEEYMIDDCGNVVFNGQLLTDLFKEREGEYYKKLVEVREAQKQNPFL